MTEQNNFSESSADWQQACWTDYRRTGDLDERNRLVMHYIPMVKRVINRLFPTSRHYYDYDDLVSCGVLGLIDAVSRYDPARPVKFETYAQFRIRGEILDYMRHEDWAPVSLRNKIKQVEAAGDQLAQNMGRPATEQEIAEQMGISVSDLQSTLGDAHALNLVYLDELLGDANGGSDLLPTDPGFDQNLENKEILQLISSQIDQLSEKEQLMLNLYYRDELTFKEIGSVMNLSESRICQIHSGILLKLRTVLKKELPLSWKNRIKTKETPQNDDKPIRTKIKIAARRENT
ncbi:MAG: FliA/WhiG family RNA polymerase sigma factor [Clostridiaceae bacterium]|nr:FliA/WhiG family RNA polymerase sigma factor [Clostridiaceae bacterium]